MAKKRVNTEVKTAGTVNSKYVWVDGENVTLRNGKGHRILKPRKKAYTLPINQPWVSILFFLT